ncbi:MAG: hypothetical protein M1130_13010 [Actinobacteria bacterium]|nr:hypothetical protein [Actinomycetota bacterium]
MEDKEFKEFVVGTLKELVGKQNELASKQDELINRQDGLDNSVQQLKEDMNSEFLQVKYDLKRIDKKTDAILKYVEHLDTDLQRHKIAERS